MKIHDDKFNKDYYLEWSTVVDAPVTYGGSLDDFKEYYKEKYGTNGLKELEEQRLPRVEQNGISAHPPFDNLENYFSCNRVGEKEKSINKEQILERFCRNQIG